MRARWSKTMKKDVIILGIHDGHNAGAALIKNGSVAAAIQEDKITGCCYNIL